MDPPFVLTFCLCAGIWKTIPRSTGSAGIPGQVERYPGSMWISHNKKRTTVYKTFGRNPLKASSPRGFPYWFTPSILGVVTLNARHYWKTIINKRRWCLKGHHISIVLVIFLSSETSKHRPGHFFFASVSEQYAGRLDHYAFGILICEALVSTGVSGENGLYPSATLAFHSPQVFFALWKGPEAWEVTKSDGSQETGTVFCDSKPVLVAKNVNQ